MDDLRHLMDALRALAREPATDANRLPVAEMRINEYLWSLQGGARQSAIERLRDAIRTEANARPTESEFWHSAEEYISTLKR
jgi:hypothetical protein